MNKAQYEIKEKDKPAAAREKAGKIIDRYKNPYSTREGAISIRARSQNQMVHLLRQK